MKEIDIQYLLKLKNNVTIGRWTNRGMSLFGILKLENEYNDGGKFPKSVREFLFLAGDFNNLDLDVYPDYFKMQEVAKETLDMYEVTIERPFFVISQYDNCMQFLFIYLDEAEDDPKVYACYVDYIEDFQEFITPIDQKRFVKFIDDLVVKAISDDTYLRFSRD